MSRFSEVKVIREFINSGITYGIYSANFNGEQSIFIRNDNSVGVVTFLKGEPSSKCISTIRDDVKQELFSTLKEIL